MPCIALLLLSYSTLYLLANAEVYMFEDDTLFYTVSSLSLCLSSII